MNTFARVPVSGGELGTYTWHGRHEAAPVVLAVHGITANAMSWARVAHHLAGERSLIAPDLRGRASSGEVGGPYGVAAHAEDLRAVLDGFGVQHATLVGHSMGAYVAAVAAARYPERFTSAVLVDGGVALAVPAAEDVDATLNAILGPAMKRLEMTFPDEESYRDYWRAHPALEHPWPEWVDDYLMHDLAGARPELYSSCGTEAVRADGADVLTDPETHTGVHALTAPSVLLFAPRGLQNERPGLYTHERLAEQALPIDAVEIPETNHYTITLSDAGAAAVADRIRAATPWI